MKLHLLTLRSTSFFVTALFFGFSARAELKSSVLTSCSGEQEGIHYTVALSTTSEAELFLKSKRLSTVCHLRLTGFDDARKGQIPFYGFAFARDKACTPALDANMVRALRDELYLGLPTGEKPNRARPATFAFLFRRNAADCQRLNVREADLKIFAKRMKMTPPRSSEFAAEEPSPIRTKSKLEHTVKPQAAPRRAAE